MMKKKLLKEWTLDQRPRSQSWDIKTPEGITFMSDLPSEKAQAIIDKLNEGLQAKRDAAEWKLLFEQQKKHRENCETALQERDIQVLKLSAGKNMSTEVVSADVQLKQWAEIIADGLFSMSSFDRDQVIILLKANMSLAVEEIINDAGMIENEQKRLSKLLGDQNRHDRQQLLDRMTALRVLKNNARHNSSYIKLCRVIYRKYGAETMEKIKQEAFKLAV